MRYFCPRKKEWVYKYRLEQTLSIFVAFPLLQNQIKQNLGPCQCFAILKISLETIFLFNVSPYMNYSSYVTEHDEHNAQNLWRYKEEEEKGLLIEFKPPRIHVKSCQHD